ncbi:MAG TPA: beta-ketoacyl-ACP synthase III, partial [Candidatus Dormibacteraeota bacterium]|nr:beta-ketoacyl-ACP synthase III [Candidatus Dormibacteraeota bacterium]
MAISPPRVRSDAVPLRAWKAQGRASAIVGMGTYAPPQVVTNLDLEASGLNTSDQWIRERTGIESRHVAAPGTSTFSIAYEASVQALAAANIGAADLDLILVATSTPDGAFPSVACRLQEQLGVPGPPAMDLVAACSGFVYALSVADAFISSGQANTVLVVGAEVMSRMVDWTDRSTCVLFADGAGAAVLRPAARGAGFMSWCLGADGRGWDQVTCGNIPFGEDLKGRDDLSFIKMQGPDVFRFATDILIRQAQAVAKAAELTMDDIDLWVPHQANRRIIEAAARRIGLPMDKVAVNIETYGNTSTASIPLALEEALRQGRVKSGDRVLMAGFGSGLTWGACLLE